jgi:pullulanase/glycogen debranching enzyme
LENDLSPDAISTFKWTAVTKSQRCRRSLQQIIAVTTKDFVLVQRDNLLDLKDRLQSIDEAWRATALKGSR